MVSKVHDDKKVVYRTTFRFGIFVSRRLSKELKSLVYEILVNRQTFRFGHDVVQLLMASWSTRKLQAHCCLCSFLIDNILSSTRLIENAVLCNISSAVA